VYATKQIIFPRCGPQRRKIISVVGNNADHISALWATTQKKIKLSLL
jgi:hypothetical protein